MKVQNLTFFILVILIGSILLAGCLPTGPCEFTPNGSLTAYRLPDETSDVFGVVPTGSYTILAQTTDGWIGFDPGVAQAGNIGLAHHRWVRVNPIISSSCISSVDLVTLADVLVDVAASNP
ncbi:MAG: hypothetical protein HQ574_08640 [Chloroflexi bacterium]|nr:hypothetical protein [Chloroflexota bacterium]